MFWPRTKSTTRRALRGGTRTNRATALASIPGLPLLQGRGARRMSPVPLEAPGGREFAQLVPHHVLGDVDRHELLAVVHGESVADELLHHSGPARPGLEDLEIAGPVHRLNPPQ